MKLSFWRRKCCFGNTANERTAGRRKLYIYYKTLNSGHP